jgi:8-oxo-dGTP pyrophosphatase MutT (NUDIX family)
MTDWRILDPDDALTATRADDRALARRLVAEADLPAGLEAVRERVLALCDAGPDPLDRATLPDHLTASAVVVAPGRGALLLHHRKLGRWFQPGGHVDGDGNLLAAACREAAEETGLVGLRPVLPALDLDVHDVPYPDGSFHVHHDLRFLLLAPPGAEEAHNEESTGARWVTGDADLDALDADESTRRLVRRGLAVAAALG